MRLGLGLGLIDRRGPAGDGGGTDPAALIDEADEVLLDEANEPLLDETGA